MPKKQPTDFQLELLSKKSNKERVKQEQDLRKRIFALGVESNKERQLRIAQPSDLVQMCLLYALLNAVVHHFIWAYLQPEQLLSVSQLPIMIVGDLLGALLGAFLFTLVMRRSGLYPLIERLSKDKPASPP